jgi:hypothetical protein
MKNQREKFEDELYALQERYTRRRASWDQRLDSLNQVNNKIILGILEKHKQEEWVLRDSLSRELTLDRQNFISKRKELNERFAQEREKLQEELNEAEKESSERIFAARELADEQINAIKTETAEIMNQERQKIQELQKKKSTLLAEIEALENKKQE